MRKSTFDFLFPHEKLTIYPEDMRTILNYQERINRDREFIESSAEPARTNQLVRSYNRQKEKFDYETSR